MRVCKGLSLHLQHDYCAICFRATPGCFSSIDRNDNRLDSVQASHALKGRNGLRLLDLSRSCDPRAMDHHECRMLCLVFFASIRTETHLNFFCLFQVCGGTVMDTNSPDWELTVAFVKPMEDRDDEVKRMSVMRQASLRNRCRFTSRWNTFVHSG